MQRFSTKTNHALFDYYFLTLMDKIKLFDFKVSIFERFIWCKIAFRFIETIKILSTYIDLEGI